MREEASIKKMIEMLDGDLQRGYRELSKLVERNGSEIDISNVLRSLSITARDILTLQWVLDERDWTRQ